MTQSNYSTTEASQLLGVTRRQLQHWDETGLLVPKRWPGPIACQPNNRFYSLEDIERARLIRQLLERGLRTKAIRRILDQLLRRRDGENWMAIYNGKCRFFAHPKDLIAYGARIAGGMLTVEIDG